MNPAGRPNIDALALYKAMEEKLSSCVQPKPGKPALDDAAKNRKRALIRVGLNQNNQLEFQDVDDNQWQKGMKDPRYGYDTVDDSGYVEVDAFRESEKRLVEVLKKACQSVKLQQRTVEPNTNEPLLLSNSDLLADLQELARYEHQHPGTFQPQPTPAARPATGTVSQPQRPARRPADTQPDLPTLVTSYLTQIADAADYHQLDQCPEWGQLISLIQQSPDFASLQVIQDTIDQSRRLQKYNTTVMRRNLDALIQLIGQRRTDLLPPPTFPQPPVPMQATTRIRVPLKEIPESRMDTAVNVAGALARSMSDVAAGGANQEDMLRQLNLANQFICDSPTLLALGSSSNIVLTLTERRARASGHFDRQTFEMLVKENIEAVRDYRRQQIETALYEELKELTTELIHCYANQCVPDDQSIDALRLYLHQLPQLLGEDTRRELRVVTDWLQQACEFPLERQLPPPEVIRLLNIDLQELENEALRAEFASLTEVDLAAPRTLPPPPVCQLAMSQPLCPGLPVDYEKEPEAIREVRANHANPKAGLPVRCIGHYQFGYFSNVYDVQARKLEDPGLSSMVMYRPVSYLFEGAKLNLFLNSGMIIGFDPAQLRPWAIFKRNAFTNAFTGLSKEAVERQANDRAARAKAKRQGGVEALGEKMLERSRRYATLDKKLKTNSHFDVQRLRWTEPKEANSGVSNSPVGHNEVIVGSIMPNAIAANIHCLDPECFAGNRTPFWYLGERLEQHCALEKDTARLSIKQSLPFVVYSPYFCSLIEVGSFEDMVPEALRGRRDLGQLIRDAGMQLHTSCKNHQIAHNTVDMLLVRAPMKAQLEFLHRHSGFPQGKEAALRSLWSVAFEPPIRLSAPDDPAATTQELLNRFYYSPRSFEEMKGCIARRKLPHNLAGRSSPVEGIQCAMNCEWFCQLLETEGVDFSGQEKLLLTYAALLDKAGERQGDAAVMLKKTFRQHFDPNLLEAMSEALDSRDRGDYHPDPRVRLFQHVLRFSSRLPSHCQGGGQNPVDDAWLADPAKLRALSVPEELLAKNDFVGRLMEGIHGTVDLMQVTGSGSFEDRRTRKRFDKRHGLAELTADLNMKRKDRFVVSGNVWREMHRQAEENCKRQVCVEAGCPVKQTLQLDAFSLPKALTTLDMLSVSRADVRESLKPLVQHIRGKGLARPTGNLTVTDRKKVDGTPAARKMLEEEERKRPGPDILDQVRSPSAELYSKRLREKNEYLRRTQAGHNFG